MCYLRARCPVVEMLCAKQVLGEPWKSADLLESLQRPFGSSLGLLERSVDDIGDRVIERSRIAAIRRHERLQCRVQTELDLQ